MENETLAVTEETIAAIRTPVTIDGLSALQKAAEQNKPPQTRLFIRQEGPWFLIDAKRTSTDQPKKPKER